MSKCIVYKSLPQIRRFWFCFKVFFGGIGIGGELEGRAAVLWLEGLLFWLEPEATALDVK